MYFKFEDKFRDKLLFRFLKFKNSTDYQAEIRNVSENLSIKENKIAFIKIINFVKKNKFSKFEKRKFSVGDYIYEVIYENEREIIVKEPIKDSKQLTLLIEKIN
jgi:hypothetical protein